jgi:DNA-binding transcriptional LysR family regulator
MIKLDGIVAFVAVADAGSITEAARRLRLSKSVISERLAELERELGASLVQRTTRKLTLTEDGSAFLARASHIVQEVVEAAAELSERHGTLTGPLRISAPVSFGTLHLGPALLPFLKANPGLELTLDLDDRFVDAAADGYDAVVRHGPLRDSGLVARPLAPSRRMLVASRAYLAQHGTPRSLTELEQHRAILYTHRGASDWRFRGSERMQVVRPQCGLRVNNGIVMRDAALAGLGIALLPSFVVHAELASGALQRVDVGAEPEGAVLHIAYPQGSRGSLKVRALTDSLRRTFGDPPYWDAAAANAKEAAALTADRSA